MTGLISAIFTMDFDAQILLARSVVEHAPAVRGLQTCQMLEEQSIVLPMTAAVTTPPGIASEIPIHHVPALHASILELDRPDPSSWACCSAGNAQTATSARTSPEPAGP